MKKSLLFFTLLCFVGMAKAQIHQHDGLYLSMGIGTQLGGITDKTNGKNVIYSGLCPEFDFKIGGAIKENIILHATVTSNVIIGPTVDSVSSKVIVPRGLSLGESFLGGGLTYYIMPSNFFVSASLGVGFFDITEADPLFFPWIISTKRTGFSMQLKAGKEWWVSNNWGLGVAIAYGKTVSANNAGTIYTDLDSNRFSVSLSATFN